MWSGGGGVAQGELVKKLAQDWSKRKKLTTAAVYADHFAVSCLVFLFEYSRFLNPKPFLNCY